MTLLPSTYLPPISYFTTIVNCSEGCTIDIGEHFVKRTLRNRCRIMTAQGVMELTVPVKGANTPRRRVGDIEIDYSKRWQHQHWIAILSAYKSSPYFDHYAPYIEPIYRERWERLSDLNHALITLIIKLLQLPSSATPEISQHYIEATHVDLDLRAKGAIEREPSSKPYIQVFCDRQPFVENLSILDLLLCEGPNALSLLVANRR